MNNIEAYILIGGRSSRFGTDKAMAEFHGQTMAARTFETVSAALPTSRITFVAGNEAQFAIEAVSIGAPFIFDIVKNLGPLGGLHAAIADARTPWIFVIACDYPFVTASFVQLLADQIADEFGAVVPIQQDGRVQPLCAFYNVAKTQPVIQELIDAPRVPPPLYEIVEQLDPWTLPYSDYSTLPGAGELFVNINTTFDLDRALEKERKLSAAT